MPFHPGRPPSSHQALLQKAGSTVDFSQSITGYNNKVVVATGDQKLGGNTDINVAAVPPNTADTREKGIIASTEPAVFFIGACARRNAASAQGTVGSSASTMSKRPRSLRAVWLQVYWDFGFLAAGNYIHQSFDCDNKAHIFSASHPAVLVKGLSDQETMLQNDTEECSCSFSSNVCQSPAE